VTSDISSHKDIIHTAPIMNFEKLKQETDYYAILFLFKIIAYLAFLEKRCDEVF